jgi:DNA polymerase-1
MVVGEAPGFREDEISKPFSGKSGQYLTEVLAKNGLSREDAFITNANKCRPPENRTPNKTEQKACRHYLDDEIEAVNPPFMLLLGNGGLSTIRKSGIMKHRGNITQFGEAQVFPTLHPAAVLRNPRNGPLFEADIAAFARLMRGQDADTPPPRVFLVMTKQALAKACKAIMLSEAVAYDIETNGFDEFDEEAKIATISVSPAPGIAFVIPIEHPESPWKSPMRVLKILGNALMFTSARRIAHNGKFDDRWLNQFGVPINCEFDTMLAAHMLDENRLKGLKPLAMILLGVDAWAIDMAGGAAMTTPLKKLARYNAKDTDYTLRLYYIFKQQLVEQPRIARVFSFLIMPTSKNLTTIERVGLYVDQTRLAERRIEVQKLIAKSNKRLVKMVGYEANWNSPQQLARILFEQLKLPIMELTAKGAASTRESVLLRLREEHAIAEEILTYRKWSGYENRYFRPWTELQHERRLHANYKIAGTVTGRLSSGKEEGNKGRGLNAQQIPRDDLVRGVIGAPPGWKFIDADFSQAEMRIAAHYSQDPTLLRIYHTGRDVHMEMACKITGKPANAVTKEERKRAKSVNFGFLFGMGAKKFVEYARDTYEIVVSETEAKEYRDAFFASFSHLQAWHSRQRRLVRNYGWVASGIGRVRHLPDVYSEDDAVRGEAERQAINSPVQGLASDMMLLAMAILHDEMDPKECRIVGTVHDSMLVEAREDRAKHWSKRIKHVMENLPLKKKFGLDLTIPVVADVKLGDHWGEGEEIA